MKDEINSQVTAVNLDGIKIVKVLFSLYTFDVRVLKEGYVERILAKKTLHFSFSNGSLNSLLGLGVIFLLYDMNIQRDSF